MNKVGIWISSITGAIVLIGALLWGVPWYIQGQVIAQVKLELAEVSTPQAVVDNTAALKAFGEQLTGMENRMIARDKFFMEYLERQAN